MTMGSERTGRSFDDAAGLEIARKLRAAQHTIEDPPPGPHWFLEGQMARCPGCGHGIGVVDGQAAATVHLASLDAPRPGLVHKCVRCHTLVRVVTHAA